MNVTETLSEGLKREFKVVVGADDLEHRVTDKLAELARNARMPGFRPGKVPVTLLRKTHGKRVLGEAIEEAINDATSKTLQENALRPALQPKIEITDFDEGKDLQYTLAVEVLPEIEPTDFRSLKLERLVAEVDDAEVEERLKAFADQMKAYADAAEGQAAQEGDAVVIDFTGTVDGEAFEGGSASDFQLELGSKSFIPGFEEQLVGARAGETRTVEVSFPEAYGNAALAGRTARFEVAVKQVKAPLPTPIDDSLAEKFGLENLEALREAIRQELRRSHNGLSRARLKRSLLDALAERHHFEVPAGMVEMEFESIWQQMKQQSGGDAAEDGEAAEATGDDEAARKEYHDIAERRVRLGLLLSEVGRRNHIQVSQDEVNRAIAEQARQFPGRERMVFEHYQRNPEAVAQLQAPVLEEKVCDFILEMADVSERTVPLAELLRDPDEDAEEAAKPEEAQKKKASGAKRASRSRKKAAEDNEGEGGESAAPAKSD